MYEPEVAMPEEELKRADHLIYVSLKYTRTCDIMKNAIKRLISAFELAMQDYLEAMRKKKKIGLKVIFEHGMPKNKIALAEVKYLPKGMASPAATNIYADKVAILVWSDSPIIVLIKNKAIADSYRKYFNLIWRVAGS